MWFLIGIYLACSAVFIATIVIASAISHFAEMRQDGRKVEQIYTSATAWRTLRANAYKLGDEASVVWCEERLEALQCTAQERMQVDPADRMQVHIVRGMISLGITPEETRIRLARWKETQNKTKPRGELLGEASSRRTGS